MRDLSLHSLQQVYTVRIRRAKKYHMDLGDTLKGMADGAVENVQDAVKDGVVDKINDVTGAAIDSVEAIADKVGLGDMLDSVVNKVEDSVNLDIDGDGDEGAK
jgi:hypothetical protein